MTKLGSKKETHSNNFLLPERRWKIWKHREDIGLPQLQLSREAEEESKGQQYGHYFIPSLETWYKIKIPILLLLCTSVQGSQHTFQVKAGIFSCDFAKLLLFSYWTVGSFFCPCSSMVQGFQFLKYVPLSEAQSLTACIHQMTCVIHKFAFIKYVSPFKKEDQPEDYQLNFQELRWSLQVFLEELP